jgi:hypothetical protein
MNVYKKLNAARTTLQGWDLSKSGHNKFAGYKYFELGDFLPAINTIFDDVGLCGVVSFTADLATLTIADIEDGSQVVITSPMGSAVLKGCHEVQNIGAVETYQRRYLWVTAMEIVEHDALDATNGKEAPEGRAKAALKPVMELVMPSFDALPADEQEFILNVAMEITAAMNDEDMTEAHRLASSLDNDEKLALWSRLDSKQRSALKRHAESLKG